MAEAIEREIENIGVMLDVLTDHTRVISEEVMPMRLRVATQLMAALLEPMHGHTPWNIARRAVELADALIDVVDE